MKGPKIQTGRFLRRAVARRPFEPNLAGESRKVRERHPGARWLKPGSVALTVVLAARVLAADAYEARTETLAAVPTNIAKEVVTDDGRHVIWIDRTPQHGCIYLDGRAGPIAVVGSGPVVSPDGRHVAYKVAVEDGKKRAAMLDGKAGPTFDQVFNDSIAFTPDNRLLYTALRGSNTVGMLDGKVVVDGLFRGGPVFSPDYKRVVLKVAPGDAPKRRAVVVDGRQGPVFDQIMGQFEFTPDSAHLAYIAQNGPGSDSLRANNWIAVLDGEPGPVFNRIDALGFIPGGAHLAYIGLKAGRQCLVIDQKPGPEYDEVDPYFLRFTADGRHVGYRAQKGDRWMVVLDGREGAACEGILDWALSPDGAREAIAVRSGGRWFVEVDGKPAPACDGIGLPLLFSAEGKHLAWRSLSAGKWTVVSDSQSGGAWDMIASGPVFSPDGSHLAYVALKEGRCFVVMDGQADGPFDWFAGTGAQFSPDGRRVAYAVQKNGAWHVVVDRQPGPAFDEIGAGPLRFSPDGKHLLCVARQGASWQVVVDGQPGPSYERILGGAPAFDADGSVTYLAVKDQTLCRVHLTQKN